MNAPYCWLKGSFQEPDGLRSLLVGFYAGWITSKMMESGNSAYWRRTAWTVFTVVFFIQLVLGLAGYEKFLMTGKLHLPVPVMILSGPIFKGSISFMPVLFLSTVLISGPAWCSQLCYFGALDALAAKRNLSGINCFPSPAVMPEIPGSF